MRQGTQVAKYDDETGKLVRRVINRPRVVDREVHEEFEDETEIIPPDTRSSVIDTTRVPYRFICNLQIRYLSTDRKINASGDGTGILIGGRHVLTCAHNIRKIHSDNKSILEAQVITVYPGKSTRLPVFKWTPFGSSIAQKDAFKTPPLWLDATKKTTNEQYDYGLITLKQDIATKTYKAIGDKPLGFWGSLKEGGNTKIKALAPAALANKAVFCAGYPGDRCGDKEFKNVCLPPGKKQGTQYVGIGTVVDPAPASHPRQLWHNVDTKEGQSGSPVWRVEPSDSNLYLVGVHIRWRYAGNTGVPINQSVRITDEVLKTLRGWGWNG